MAMSDGDKKEKMGEDQICQKLRLQLVIRELQCNQPNCPKESLFVHACPTEE